jgi:hypothetical protein
MSSFGCEWVAAAQGQLPGAAPLRSAQVALYGEAKVGGLHGAAGLLVEEEEVVGLDVAVDDAARVALSDEPQHGPATTTQPRHSNAHRTRRADRREDDRQNRHTMCDMTDRQTDGQTDGRAGRWTPTHLIMRATLFSLYSPLNRSRMLPPLHSSMTRCTFKSSSNTSCARNRHTAPRDSVPLGPRACRLTSAPHTSTRPAPKAHQFPSDRQTDRHTPNTTCTQSASWQSELSASADSSRGAICLGRIEGHGCSERFFPSLPRKWQNRWTDRQAVGLLN